MLQAAEDLQSLDRSALAASSWARRLFLGKALTRWLILYVLNAYILRSADAAIFLSLKRVTKFTMYSIAADELSQKLLPRIKKRFRALKMNINLAEKRRRPAPQNSLPQP